MIYGLPETKSELRGFTCGDIQSKYYSLDRSKKTDWRKRAARTGCIQYWITGNTVEIRTFDDVGNDYPTTCRWYDNVGALVDIAANVVASYVANNAVRAGDLPELLASVHKTLCDVHAPSLDEATDGARKMTRAQIRKSISADALISFEDGKPYKTLRRHLILRGLTPEAYRLKWGLPADYPMTAQSYSEQRSALARSLGLGKARGSAAPGAGSADTTIKAKRGSRSRPPKKRSDK